MIFKCPSIFFVVSITFCFFSCSNRVATDQEDIDTLRVISERRSQETEWMEELEGKILTEKVPRLESIASNVSLSPQSAAVSTQSRPLYPFIPDFGSLDTSNISYKMRTITNNFFNSLISEAPTEEYEKMIQSDMVFSLLFFLSDISEISGGENKKFFTSFILGAPYITRDAVEIPVRLFCVKGTVDCAIFISNDEEPKINQLLITNTNLSRSAKNAKR